MISDVHPPHQAVREVVERALAEDLIPLGDITSALLPSGVGGRAAARSRADGVLAGARAATETFRQVDPALSVQWRVDDGDRVCPGDTLATVEGPLESLLVGERTALNFLGHLSGVATLTRRFVDLAGGGAEIWDTRKTTPGLRALEKAAVRAGGGHNHRGNLSDWVLLKDNHLVVLGITEGVRAARDRWPGRTVHVECESLEQVKEAVAAGADAVLLDNMSPGEVRRCVEQASGSATTTCLFEASGGITLDNVAEYAVTGVDLISTGLLTSSAPALDIGLDVSGESR